MSESTKKKKNRSQYAIFKFYVTHKGQFKAQSLHIYEVRTSKKKEKRKKSIIKMISVEFSVDQLINHFNCKCYIIGSLLLTGSM